MPPGENPSLSNWPQLLNWGKLESNMLRFIDNKLAVLPTIIDITKKCAFQDLDPEDELAILAKKINWKILEHFLYSFILKI
jgi:hypothetical protein